MPVILRLDDMRNPEMPNRSKIHGNPIEAVWWVKNYQEFVHYITNSGLPDIIWFDHDLGEEKSGYDCMKWLVNYCIDNNEFIPICDSQSSNPEGKKNILTMYRNYLKFTYEN